MNPFLRFLLKPSFERLLRIDPESKPAVYIEVFDGADISNTNYWLELLLSAGIATLGLLLDSPAVVIGAMLVSPLMGPIIAAGLAFAAADLYLGIKSLLQLGLSIFGSILFAGFLVWILPLDAPTAEIQARTHPNLLDLGIALFSGLAGSLLLARSKSPGGGGAAALPGVAIAVALMPPLCAVGFGLGAGFVWEIMSGAGLLFITNLAAIIASAFLVFYVIRMDSVEVRLAIAAPLLERASNDSIYDWLASKTAISRSFANIGALRWRIFMIVCALGVVLVPLSRSLMQLTQQLVARDAVENAVEMITEKEGIVSMLYTVHDDPITLNLIVTNPVDRANVAAAEAMIEARTNREASLTVRQVASQEELVQLRQGIGGQAAQSTAVKSLEAFRAELMGRLDRPLEELWPTDHAQVVSTEIGFDARGAVLRIRYQAEEDFTEASRDVLRRGMAAELGDPRLRLELERAPQSSEQAQ